ncbi:MAG TPA: ATP-binding protein [bacterium]|nr:ATP-binding protein [bacterium]
MRSSLRWKLTGSYLLVVLFSLAVAAAVLIPLITRFYLMSYQRDVLNQARMVARMLEVPQAQRTSLSRLDRIAAGFAWRDGVYIGVRDAAGHPLPTSQWDTSSSGPVEPEVAAAAHGQPTASVRYDPPRKEARVFAAAPIVNNGLVRGVVQVSVPRIWVDRALQPAWFALGVALVIGTMGAWVLGVWRARALSWPVLELARAAQGISAGDLTRRVDVGGGDEIAQLAGSFNTMAWELRQKLTAISEERGKIEAIISSMNDAVVAVDAQGTVLLVNQAAGDLLGLGPSARGRSLRTMLGEHPLCRCIDATAAYAGEIEEEVSLGPPDERLLEVHATTLRPTEGIASGVVAVVRDVTVLRQAERLRRELTANVSHELRTPLTSIKGFAETLLGGAMADEDTCRRFLTIIDNEASRLMKLVDDLMDLSRLESRAVAMEPAPVRLDHLVGEAIGRMRPQADRHHVTLRPAALAPEVVMADRDRILQVLTNLLDNAIKFTPEGGAVEVSIHPDNGGAAFTIADSGRGIPEEHLPRIFERFYRVERSRSREEGGTGLGLAIAKHIVDAHGGRITAQSRPGGGSVFTVVLPGAAPRPS